MDVVTIVATFAFLLFFIEGGDNVLVAAVLGYDVLQNPPPRPLLRAIQIIAVLHHHLILKPLLISLSHLLFVNLRMIDKANGPRIYRCLLSGGRRHFEGAINTLLLLGKFEPIQAIGNSFRNDLIIIIHIDGAKISASSCNHRGHARLGLLSGHGLEALFGGVRTKVGDPVKQLLLII